MRTYNYDGKPYPLVAPGDMIQIEGFSGPSKVLEVNDIYAREGKDSCWSYRTIFNSEHDGAYIPTKQKDIDGWPIWEKIPEPEGVQCQQLVFVDDDGFLFETDARAFVIVSNQGEENE